MAQFGGLRQSGMRVDQAIDPLHVAKEQKAELRPPLERQGGAVDDDLGRVVAPHGIQGHGDRHEPARRGSTTASGRMAWPQAKAWRSAPTARSIMGQLIVQRLFDRSRNAARAAKAERAAKSAASL